MAMLRELSANWATSSLIRKLGLPPAKFGIAKRGPSASAWCTWTRTSQPRSSSASTAARLERMPGPSPSGTR